MADKLLFIGDSLIEYYNWQMRFPDKKVWSYGVAGETVESLLRRLPGIIKHVNPDWILIMTGTNNIGMDDFGFMPSYSAVVDSFKDAFPEAEIVINSLLPFTLEWVAPSTMVRMNKRYQEMAMEKDARYFDLYSLFIEEKGQPKMDYFLEDGVHLSDTGYRVWSDAVEKII